MGECLQRAGRAGEEPLSRACWACNGYLGIAFVLREWNFVIQSWPFALIRLGIIVMSSKSAKMAVIG